MFLSKSIQPVRTGVPTFQSDAIVAVKMTISYWTSRDQQTKPAEKRTPFENLPCDLHAKWSATIFVLYLLMTEGM
jgi:hypothetical protein